MKATVPPQLAKCLFGIVMLIGAAAIEWYRSNPSVDPASANIKIARAVGSHISPQTASRHSSHSELTSALGLHRRVRHLLNVWQAESDPILQTEIQHDLDAEVTAENAAVIFKSLPPELANTAFALRVLERWTAVDRLAALEEIRSAGPVGDAALSTVLRGWVLQQNDELPVYLAGVESGPWKDRILSGVSGEAIGSRHPREAIGFLGQMQPGVKQELLLRSAASKWAEVDPPAAAEWALKIEDLPLQNLIIGGIAHGFAMTEPEAAGDWLLHFPAGDARDGAIGLVMSVWTQEHCAVGLEEWVGSLTGATKNHALHRLSLIKSHAGLP